MDSWAEISEVNKTEGPGLERKVAKGKTGLPPLQEWFVLGEVQPVELERRMPQNSAPQTCFS